MSVGEKLYVLRRRGWEVYVDYAPARYVRNIVSAVATPAEVAEVCAGGHVLFYYAASTPAGLFIYGTADPADVPGEDVGELRRVDPGFGCLVVTALKRGGMRAARELYEAVLTLEKPPMGSLSLDVIEELDLCRDPAPLLKPYCRLLDGIKRRGAKSPRLDVAKRRGGRADAARPAEAAVVAQVGAGGCPAECESCRRLCGW